MSKTKYMWYYFVRKMIVVGYYKQDSDFARRLAAAMQEANEETAKLPNGELRMLAIDEVLIRNIKTYNGVGYELNYDARTIQEWINSYVNLVGKKAGL